jgi:hypothetical protein
MMGAMTTQSLWFALLGIAVIVNGLLAGASLHQSIEQLPARHRIGMRAYLAYSRASHMDNGRFWLIPLGIVGPVLSVAAAIWALTRKLPSRAVPSSIRRWPCGSQYSLNTSCRQYQLGTHAMAARLAKSS